MTTGCDDAAPGASTEPNADSPCTAARAGLGAGDALPGAVYADWLVPVSRLDSSVQSEFI